MDLSKLRELALKKEQYNDIKKEIERAERDYSSFLYKVRDELGQRILVSLVESNKVFADFSIKNVEFDVYTSLFKVILSYRGENWGSNVYFIVANNNNILQIPALTYNDIAYKDSYISKYRLFFQKHAEDRKSLNITEIQQAWDNVCEKYQEDLNTLFKETK